MRGRARQIKLFGRTRRYFAYLDKHELKRHGLWLTDGTGFTYILRNQSFNSSIFKIGQTCNIVTRVPALYNTSIPYPFELVWVQRSVPYKEIEYFFHSELFKYRLSEKREFFDVPDDSIIKDLIGNINDFSLPISYKILTRFYIEWEELCNIEPHYCHIDKKKKFNKRLPYVEHLEHLRTKQIVANILSCAVAQGR